MDSISCDFFLGSVLIALKQNIGPTGPCLKVLHTKTMYDAQLFIWLFSKVHFKYLEPKY